MSHQLTSPASAEIYKAGTVYKARMFNGKVFSDNTDASSVINNALANITDASRIWGARVFIHAGDYDLLTSVDATEVTRGYDGIEIVGEGAGTNLMWKPTGALTHGIKTGSTRGRLANMRLYGNANVAKIVHNQSTLSATGGKFFMDFENLLVDGAPTNTSSMYYSDVSGVPTTGQIGIYIDGSTDKPSFFYNYQNCIFRGLDVGAHLYGEMSTSALINNCGGWHNNTVFKISGGQNHIQNCWVQGQTNCGNWGVYLLPEANGTGSRTVVANLTAELLKTGETCAAVYVSPGSANNRFINVRNDYANDYQWYSILNDANVVELGGGINLDVMDLPKPPFMTRWRYGSWHAGSQGPLYADGALQGNILELGGGGVISMVGKGQFQYARRYETSGSANTIKGIYYAFNQGSGAYSWNFDSYVKLWSRFFFANNTQIRFFFGLTGSIVAPVAGADPLANQKGVGIWIDTAVSSNMKAICNNGGANSSLTDLGAGIPATGNAIYAAKIQNIRDESKWAITYWYNDTNIARATLSTNVPTTGGCPFHMYMENTTAAARAFDIADIYVDFRA